MNETENFLVDVISRLEEKEQKKIKGLLDLSIDRERLDEIKMRIEAHKSYINPVYNRDVSFVESVREMRCMTKEITFFYNKITRDIDMWINVIEKNCEEKGVVELYSFAQSALNVPSFYWKYFHPMVDRVLLNHIIDSMKFDVFGRYHKLSNKYYLSKKGEFKDFEDLISFKWEIEKSQPWEEVLKDLGCDENGNYLKSIEDEFGLPLRKTKETML